MKDKMVKYLVAFTIIVLASVNVIPSVHLVFGGAEIRANLLNEVDAIQEGTQVHLKNTQFQKGSTYLLTSKTYETSQNFDDLRSFWIKEFTQAGWRINKEREIILFGYKFGEKTIEFTKGDYHATLGFEFNRTERIQSVNLDVRWDMFWRINNYLFLLIMLDFGLLGFYWLVRGGKRRDGIAPGNKWLHHQLVKISNTPFYQPTIRVVGIIMLLFAILSSYVWISLYV